MTSRRTQNLGSRVIWIEGFGRSMYIVASMLMIVAINSAQEAEHPGSRLKAQGWGLWSHVAMIPTIRDRVAALTAHRRCKFLV